MRFFCFRTLFIYVKKLINYENKSSNYYDYAKTLSAEGVMSALIGGGAEPEPAPQLPEGLRVESCYLRSEESTQIFLYLTYDGYQYPGQSYELPEKWSLGDMFVNNTAHEEDVYASGFTYHDDNNYYFATNPNVGVDFPSPFEIQLMYENNLEKTLSGTFIIIEDIVMQPNIYGSRGNQSYQAMVDGDINIGRKVVIMLAQKLPESCSLKNMVFNDEDDYKTIVQSFEYVEDDPLGFDLELVRNDGYLYVGTISDSASIYEGSFTVDIEDSYGTIKTLSGYLMTYI